MIVGLFGQVGTGKSSVSEFFRTQGWNIIDQDKLGHEVLEEHPNEIVDLFGIEVLTDNKVDRKKLGAKVFSDPEELSKLMTFSYPFIIKKTNQKISHHTLIEGAFFYKVKDFIPHDELWYIFTEHDILIERLLKRCHTMEWIVHVLKNQAEILEYRKYADFIINNNGTLEDCYQQLKLKIFR